MNVRPGTPDDIDDCANIVGGQPLWERYDYPREHVVRDLRRAICQPAAGPNQVWVAEDDQIVRGFAWIVKNGGMARSDYLRLIAVARGGEGRGVGAALLDVAEGEARRGMFLLVSDFNIHAQRFYARRGYTEVGRLPDYVVPDVVECIYYKTGAP